MSDLLTPQDVTLIERLAVISQEAKELKEKLAPKIEASFRKYGAGNVTIGARIVKLSSIDRNNVSWKGLAEANLPAATIEAEKPRHTSPSVTYNAKIVGRANQASQGHLGRKVA